MLDLQHFYQVCRAVLILRSGFKFSLIGFDRILKAGKWVIIGNDIHLKEIECDLLL